MSKGQVPVGMLLSFILLIVVLAFVAVFFYGSSTPTTGQAVAESEEETKAASNHLDWPFELRAWVVDSEGVSLDVKNIGEADYSISSFEVDGCGSVEVGKSVLVGESRIFEVKCNLVEGEMFSGEIRIVYSGGVAEGFVSDLV